MVTVTLKVNEKKYMEIKNFYSSFVVALKGSNIDFIAKPNKKVIVTGYTSSKKTKSIVITGENAQKEAKRWEGKDVIIEISKEDISTAKEVIKANKKVAKPTKKEEKKPVEKKETKTEKKPTKKVEKKTTKKADNKKPATKVEKKPVVKKEVKKPVKKAEKKPTETKKENSTPTRWVDIDDQIGSDEVGVGDFLGPMIVVATYIKRSDIKLLKELGVKDSKKLTDKKILQIGPILAENLEYSKLTLSNEKYNTMIIQNENLNSLKAKMHNRALLNLTEKHPEVVGVYVDQFVSKEKFYEYLDDPEERKVRDISFRTQGESLFPSVAASSIIARYAFLKEIEALSLKYKMDIPLGASSKVNEFAKEFIKKFGITEFNKIAKRNFSNYKEVIKG